MVIIMLITIILINFHVIISHFDNLISIKRFDVQKIDTAISKVLRARFLCRESFSEHVIFKTLEYVYGDDVWLDSTNDMTVEEKMDIRWSLRTLSHAQASRANIHILLIAWTFLNLLTGSSEALCKTMMLTAYSKWSNSSMISEVCLSVLETHTDVNGAFILKPTSPL